MKYHNKTETTESVIYPESEYLKPFGMPFRVHYYKQSKTILHYHDFYELVIITGGSGRHHTATKSYPINRGDVFVIKPGMAHCYDKISELQLVNIIFNLKELDQEKYGLDEIPGYFALFEAEPDLREQSDFKGKHTFSAEQLAEVSGLLSRITEEQSREAPGYVFVCMALFHQLIAYICRCYGNSRRKTSRKMIQLSLMLKYIEENFANELTLDDIAAHGNMSISTANRLFNEMLKESPIGYLVKTRISHASELLGQGALSISEIAFRCGYSDSNYFSLQFKKCMGVSPRGFRNKSSG